MKVEDILLTQTYRGGKHNELRTVVSWGSSADYVCYAKTKDRLPLGGFTDTKCVSTKSFAKWANDFADSGWLEKPMHQELREAGEFIEVDFGGDRFTRYGKDVTIQDTTCLRQPYMNEAQWSEKLLAFLDKQPPKMGVYNCRFAYNEPGAFRRTVAMQRFRITAGLSTRTQHLEPN